MGHLYDPSFGLAPSVLIPDQLRRKNRGICRTCVPSGKQICILWAADKATIHGVYKDQPAYGYEDGEGVTSKSVGDGYRGREVAGSTVDTLGIDLGPGGSRTIYSAQMGGLLNNTRSSDFELPSGKNDEVLESLENVDAVSGFIGEASETVSTENDSRTVQVSVKPAERACGSDASESGKADASSKKILDLGIIDASSRHVLATSGYASVFDVGGIDEADNQSEHSCLKESYRFDDLLQSESLVQSLNEEFGFTNPTHVQAESIPRLVRGEDLVVQSHTGSGKTLAYILPILENLDITSKRLQALILVPTRELGMQVYRELEKLSTVVRSVALIGGTNSHRQVEKLRKTAPHIVIGTPGRIRELASVTKKHLKLRQINVLVVDEVDYFLSPVFIADVEAVIGQCDRKRQLVFVSATSDGEGVKKFAQRWMTEPKLLRVGGSGKLPLCIHHWITTVYEREKFELVRKLMYSNPQPRSAICFVSDPRRVERTTQTLISKSVSAGALRGDAHKTDRAEVLRLFRKGSVQLLVTTEVAARGLDFEKVSHIINLDLPTDSDHYLHRAGRCGRMGREGHVINIAEPGKEFVVRKFARELKLDVIEMEVRHGVYRTPFVKARDRKAVKEESRSSSDKSADETQKPPSENWRTRTRRTESNLRKNSSIALQRGAGSRKKGSSEKSRVKVQRGDENPDASNVKRMRPKVRRDIATRAKREGWVGNRVDKDKE